MYVVRIDDAGVHDFKAFSTLPRAKSGFNQALREVYEGAYQRIALYEVSEFDDPKLAIEAVRDAAVGIRLLKMDESESARLDRIVRELGPTLDLDL